MRVEMDGNRAVVTFDSFHAMIDAVDGNREFRDHYDPRMARKENGRNWYGANVRTIDDAIALARRGMPEDGIEALALAEAEIAKVEQETSFQTFDSFYDMTGYQVDIPRFLTGEPECMMNFSMVETSRVGRVVTLVNSIFTQVSTSHEEIVKRGREIVALVMAIEKAGYSVELWSDLFVTGKRSPRLGRIRTMIKQADAPLDAGDVMFAFTHPAMLRVLGFGSMHCLPYAWRKSVGCFSYYGYRPETEDAREYPEGAIFLPALRSCDYGRDILRANLRDLGIIE